MNYTRKNLVLVFSQKTGSYSSLKRSLVKITSLGLDQVLAAEENNPPPQVTPRVVLGAKTEDKTALTAPSRDQWGLIFLLCCLGLLPVLKILSRRHIKR